MKSESKTDRSDLSDKSDIAAPDNNFESAGSPGGGPAGSGKLALPLTADGVLEALKDVYDPELAINIVDLGLIYSVDIEDRKVLVRMTLTSPGCPVGPMLQSMAVGAVRRVFPDVAEAKVEIVWTPPWDPYRMASEEAKDMLGIW